MGKAVGMSPPQGVNLPHCGVVEGRLESRTPMTVVMKMMVAAAWIALVSHYCVLTENVV